MDDEQATSRAPRPAATIHALRTVRRMGLAGSLLLAVGALGAGAVPLPNPLGGLRLVSPGPARSVSGCGSRARSTTTASNRFSP